MVSVPKLMINGKFTFLTTSLFCMLIWIVFGNTSMVAKVEAPCLLLCFLRYHQEIAYFGLISNLTDFVHFKARLS
jgi:hypothetical protein